MLYEVLHHLELARAKLQRAPALRRLEGLEVHLNVAEAHLLDLFERLRRATQDGLDSRHQFEEAERLRHVVVRARLEAEHLVYLLPARGEHDDGRVVARGAKLAANVEAAHA